MKPNNDLKHKTIFDFCEDMRILRFITKHTTKKIVCLICESSHS